MKNRESMEPFEQPSPQPGEKGYLMEGYHLNAAGEIEDKQGNVYDEAYRLKREAPSDGLKMARRQHPDWDDDQLAPLARIYNQQFGNRSKRGERETKH